MHLKRYIQWCSQEFRIGSAKILNYLSNNISDVDMISNFEISFC